MVACDGEVNGACPEACVNTAAWHASSSRFGVSPRFDPRNPMRSARVVSSVINKMLGADVPAAAVLAHQHTKHNHRRITRAPNTLLLRPKIETQARGHP